MEPTNAATLPAGRQIEFAAPADIPELVRIEQQCYAQPWSGARFMQEYENPCSYILLLREQRVIVAYLCFWHVGPEVEIHNIACAPLRRRSGAAHALMTYLHDWCLAQQIEQIFLEVRRSNKSAIELYKRFGFCQCGSRAGYYSNGEDALLMSFGVI